MFKFLFRGDNHIKTLISMNQQQRKSYHKYKMSYQKRGIVTEENHSKSYNRIRTRKAPQKMKKR